MSSRYLLLERSKSAAMVAHRQRSEEEIMGHYLVWFERGVGSEVVDLIDPEIMPLGPGGKTDPFSGSSSAAGVVASSFTYDGATMDLMPKLEVIARTGIGVDQVDIVAATNRGIVVCNTPDAPTVSTAEHTFALLLAVSKRLGESASRLQAGESELYARHEAVELHGKTLGLVGYGRIARRVARIADSIGMRVVAYDRYVAPDDEFVEADDSLENLLRRSDVISVHVPLTDETRNLFDVETFAALKRGAVFINTARGGLVDHDALLGALENGTVWAAGLDVTDPEPLPPEHPLLNRADVLVTPHVAAGTTEAKRRIFETAVSEVVAVIRGDRPRHMVNPEVWDSRRSLLRPTTRSAP